jgi:hypothetical protein
MTKEKLAESVDMELKDTQPMIDNLVRRGLIYIKKGVIELL